MQNLYSNTFKFTSLFAIEKFENIFTFKYVLKILFLYLQNTRMNILNIESEKMRLIFLNSYHLQYSSHSDYCFIRSKNKITRIGYTILFLFNFIS